MTGRPHWGNYFAAISQYIALQNNEQAFYFIADLHAPTTIRAMRSSCGRTRSTPPSIFAALELDPQQATLFVQSEIPEVTELTWLLRDRHADVSRRRSATPTRQEREVGSRRTRL